MPKGNKIEQLTSGQILSWADVERFHKVRNGIYQRRGRVISLLTDLGRINPCYPDRSGDSNGMVSYHGYGRRGDQKLDASNRALFNAIESGHSVPLFNKLSVGRWEFMGTFRVERGEYIYDETQRRMIWRFTLRNASHSHSEMTTQTPE